MPEKWKVFFALKFLKIFLTYLQTDVIAALYDKTSWNLAP